MLATIEQQPDQINQFCLLKPGGAAVGKSGAWELSPRCPV
jgi:hypothetical protein